MSKQSFGPVTHKHMHARLMSSATDTFGTSTRKRAQARVTLQNDGTRRGVPADYKGDDPRLCNARTRSGRPCRALKLKGGRCKMHGGMSTGPKTPEGRARCAENLRRWREKHARSRRPCCLAQTR